MPDVTANQGAWYTLSAEDTARQLQVDPARGLTASEAQQRLEQYGPNQLAAKKKESGLQAFLRQYKDFMQILLLGAALVNQIFTQELGTTLVLIALTVFNAVLGMNQESKAEASLAALEKMMKNIARVRRDGQAIEVEAEQLVPGDIVLMEAGNRVPADGRLFVTATLEIEEAALTGESVASPKDTDTIAKSDVPLGDRHNMAYMNTSVTRGRGEMIVTTTGMGTEMGHIADLLNKTEADKTPLQKQLDRLVVIIAIIAGITFLLMMFLGLRQGQDFDAIFLAGIALAISAIPTGMPAVITTLYSMGTRVLAQQNAIVKRLPSVETLGSVSAICSDKTGTLTLNKMTAVEFSIPGQNRFRVTGEGYSTKGELQLTRGIPAGQPWQKGSAPYTTEGQIQSAGGARIDLDQVMLPMALCADARLDGESLIGDPTEGALIVLAEKGGISVEAARQQYPRLAEVPFDSEYKFMATFHTMTDSLGKPVVRAFVKGAPDVLIARAGYFWLPDGEAQPVTDEKRGLALMENERMAAAGERVMVVACRDFDPSTFDPKGKLIDLMTDLTLLAMVGIVDPPRSEARDAIARCHSAGIQVRMITGDHAVTAAAIGKQLGIEGEALTGAQFSAMSDEQLTQNLDGIGVIARVAPEDKIRLVDLLQRKQNIVAMTGDGVNDAPALKKADIGVAMGITGTEVSKGAAVMILTDDNFATIVKAVEYGRAIYDNLAKYVRYQITALVAFIASYLGAALFFILGGVPFSPLVVLYINFLVQVPIAIALGFDKPLPGLMDRKPRPLSQPVLSRAQWARLIFSGALVALGTLAVEATYEAVDPVLAASMGFAVFSLFNVAMGISNRSETESAFQMSTVTDRRQLGLYGLAILLTYLPTELGFTQRILGLVPLALNQWLLCVGLAFVLVLVYEVMKVFLRRRGDAAQPATTASASA
ncbi:MAG: cation-translocating P-type ATPase [Caldilinea sp.]|nr:cation-translocating P-type ATPase [Caldilinea sp.]MCB0049635.1 cation-translocating P-type ATPase [Caldilinea sp.]MCB0147008.1 cation-translocating P-type ATPase [Caldilineaceae bacterium]MCB9118356.1 cation-translocating P-type ATPase [Caldilineaceae bacterium]MCB9124944.1 cation-translocating P-type ATPase [Caldilineaceae bacterium]